MARRVRNLLSHRRTRAAVARLVGLVALVTAIFAATPESTARLQPYYLVRGTAAGQINPRVLFAVDTSGSMVWWPDATGCPYSQQNRARQCDCAWNECEDTSDPSKMSRIAGARAAIRAVVEGTEGAADFALMTFGSVPPPRTAGDVPNTCSGGNRFAWVEQATAYAGRQDAFGPWGDAAPPGQTGAQRGTWALCGENRPFPYFRADELGLTVPGSFDPDNLPEGPLFNTWGGTWAQWTDSATMESRRVQWLPAFMGVHFRIPCADVVTGDEVSRSYGDYIASEMCDQDFFYVPYVDGFSGYSAMTGYSSSGNVRMGIHERAFNIQGTLDICVLWNDPCCEDYCQDNTDFQTCTEECDTTGTPPPAPTPGCGYYYDFGVAEDGDGAHLSCSGSSAGAGTCTCSAGGLPSVTYSYTTGGYSGCQLGNATCISDCEAHCTSGQARDAVNSCVDCYDSACVLECIDNHCDGGPVAGTHPGDPTCAAGPGACGYYVDQLSNPTPQDGAAPVCTSNYDVFSGNTTCYCDIGATTIDPFVVSGYTLDCDRATCLQTCEVNCAAGCYSDVFGDFDCYDSDCMASCAQSFCGGGGLTGTNPGDPVCGAGGGPVDPCPSAGTSICSTSNCPGGSCSCSCTIDGDTFNCGTDYACWQTQVSDCQTSCGIFSYLGCAKQRYETNCNGGAPPDCQETCEDRTEDCLDSCSGANSCPVCEEWETTSGTGNASLLSPFWSQGAIDRFSGIFEGPATSEDAQNTLVSLTSHPMYGGMGAQSGTPWSTAIGDVLYLPTDPLPAGPNNAPYSHNTVASYLSLMAHPDLGGTSACAPLSLVVITDGEPSPSSEGGTNLYGRLSALRTSLGVKVYVVGFTLDSSQLNNMACAAAGGGSSNPCSATPSGAFDTCRDSANPTTDCAYLASNPDELADVLRVIMVDQASTAVPAGLGSSVNEFLDTSDPNQKQALQTAVEGFTEMPEFEGHVQRVTCDADDFPDFTAEELAAACDTTAALAIDEDEDETFSSCTGGSCVCDTFSRVWDAGTCLQETPWEQRRLYTYTESGGVHSLVRIIDTSGVITTQFDNLLQGTSATSIGLPDMQDADERQAFAGYLAGENWTNDWKLAGLGKSVPVVARRIPKRNPLFAPSVGVRDPHCSGRMLNASDDVPLSLRDWSDAAWDTNNVVAPTANFAALREYQEAVLVGSDMGYLHAFQLDSGNELFAFMPPFLLANAYQKFLNGPENFGQPDAIDQQLYGISSTVNHGWSYDPTLADWRHLAVVGMGSGGNEYMVLDISHMGRLETNDPIEILWTTEDASLKSTYDALLGETWSRPALTYSFPGNTTPTSPTVEPTTHLVFASGYPDSTPTGAGQGRTVVLANAFTGAITEQARVPLPSDASLLYESESAVINDIAVTSHCLNGMWAEMQEAYFADPMGGLYRWDLGLGSGFASRDHAADSGQEWATNLVGGVPTAVPVFRFRACQGTGSSCSVDTTGGKYDYFTYGPAVAASGRFSQIPGDQTETNEFVLAMISGAPDDDAIDAGQSGSDFHSSIYLAVDDHSSGPDEHGGFNIPNDGVKTGGVTDANFFRIALSDISRTRIFTPYAGASELTETGNFARGTRPIRPPRIIMSPAGDRPDITVLYFEFVVYEPGSMTCDPRFTDGTTWYADPGGTYRILFRLTATDASGFDFLVGSGESFSGADGFAPGASGPGLSMADVQQVDGGDCGAGECGATTGTPFTPPCDNNNYGSSAADSFSIPLSHSELIGFTPVEG